MIQAMAQAQRCQQRFRARPRYAHVDVADHLGQHDIFGRIEIRQQVVELVDEAQRVAPQPRASVIIQLRGFLARDADRPFEPALQQAGRLQQRRLA